MSEIKWTKSQEKAISHRDNGVVVSAAAGSGKTAVLIERLTQMLLDEKKKIPAENLLAVTFTNDAAAQMREKLNDAIDNEITKCFNDSSKADSPRAKWLLEQKSNLQFAVISTINAFCLSFVKDNISEFEFQSGLRILDETTEKMYYEKARDIALGELCENDEASYAVLRNAFDQSGDFESILEDLYDFLRKLPFREVWIKQARAAYADEANVECAINAYNDTITSSFDEIESKLGAYNLVLGKVKEHKKANKYIDSLTKKYSDLCDLLGDIKKAYASADLKKYLECNFSKRSFKKPSISDAVLNSVGPEERLILTDLSIQADALFYDIKDLFAKLTENGFLSEKQIRDNLSDIARVFDVLIRVTESIEYHCKEMKLESNSVDFADVELMTKQLLVEYRDGRIVRTPLCENIRKNKTYRIITIDEFQDVNNLQELIFRALSDGDDLRYMGSNVFVVGDIKQAIYRFRLTNPYLFKKTVSDAQSNKGGLELIDLQENFRSRNGVIDFANFLFSNIMSEQMGGVDYDDKQKLRFGAEYYPELGDSDNKCSIEVILTNEHDEFRSDDYSEENLIIAKKIKEILDPSSDYTVMDKKTKQMRHCRPSDICILTQTNDELRKMSKALESVGLKAFSQDVEGYLKANEIILALNFLRVIDNPMNDIAITAVLMSPVFTFSADDMLRLHIERSKKNPSYPGSIYSVLSNAHLSFINKQTEDITYTRVFDDDNVLQEKCSKAFEMLDNFMYRAMSTDLERLIKYIFDATDLISLTSIYRNSDKKRANLLLFMQYAKAYEQSGSDGVTGFLRFIDSVYKNDKAFKQAAKITSSGECINIQTFHKSKGLEYPYVFLCELDNPFFRKNTDSHIVMHYKTTDDPDDINSVAFEIADEKRKLTCTNPYYDNMKDRNKLEEKSEKMRLLYVGCTRAKEKLFISVSPDHSGNTYVRNARKAVAKTVNGLYLDHSKQNVQNVISGCKCMLEWIMCGLSFARCPSYIADWLVPEEPPTAKNTDIKNADILRDRMRELFSDPSKPDIGIKFEVRELEDLSADAQVSQSIRAMPDPVLAEKLRLVYRNDSEHKEEIQAKAMLPSKLTVTEIVRNENEKLAVENEKEKGKKAISIDPDFFPSLPKLDDASGRFTPAERGTFTHKFMELADYSKACVSVSDELQRLVDSGYFTEKEAKGVYADRLSAFFKSDFYKRMQSAEELMREKQFMVAMRDITVDEQYKGVTGSDGIIQGIADCVFKEPDGYVIVDYKTDNFQSESDMDKYGTQLAFYKAALELVLGSEDPDGTIKKAVIKSCYIYSFKLGIGKEFRFS